MKVVCHRYHLSISVPLYFPARKWIVGNSRGMSEKTRAAPAGRFLAPAVSPPCAAASRTLWVYQYQYSWFQLTLLSLAIATTRHSTAQHGTVILVRVLKKADGRQDREE